MGEFFFWYRPTRVVPDQRVLNGCCCCCCHIFNLFKTPINSSPSSSFNPASDAQQTRQVFLIFYAASQCISLKMRSIATYIAWYVCVSVRYGYTDPHAIWCVDSSRSNETCIRSSPVLPRKGVFLDSNTWTRTYLPKDNILNLIRI